MTDTDRIAELEAKLALLRAALSKWRCADHYGLTPTSADAARYLEQARSATDAAGALEGT